jgi:hypothetical protein
VDLFFSYDPFHEASAKRVRQVEFAGERLPILSPEDLILHKVTFARSKDWRDIADILYSQRGAIDFSYIERWLTDFFPPDETKPETDDTRFDSRIVLFRNLVDALQQYGNENQ